jgi:hypothetical protein
MGKRKVFPKGLSPSDFQYKGRPAKGQDDFGTEVGVADMVCVDALGSSNKNKYFHAGVVVAKGRWFFYTEWGRIFSGKSWDPTFNGQDFMFIEGSEAEVRRAFEKKCREKNIKRIVQKSIAGKEIWVSRSGKDGYIIQSLATRERGLPDAYRIKDDSGVVKESKNKKKRSKKSKPKKKYQKQVVSLANSLVGGTQNYAKAVSQATSVTPTLESIKEVRDDLIPAALDRLKVVGDKMSNQLKDKDLVDISHHVAALVPRPIPRNSSKEQRAEILILNGSNILSIQQDLDAFEAALRNEDFEIEDIESSDNDPFEMLGCEIEWLDPKSTKGKWIKSVYESMSNNRHSYIRGRLVVKNIFEVNRPKLDKLFQKEAEKLSKAIRSVPYRARLQPDSRSDVSDISDYVTKANVFLGIHGTRAVNVQPIISSNLRLPKQLKGVQISGAAFGHGIYFATDWRKSYGYTGHGNSVWSKGGTISGRGFFMFLCDVVMGKAYMASRTGSWVTPPNKCTSIAAYPEHTSVANDEHIIFNPNHQRIRYIIEADLR